MYLRDVVEESRFTQDLDGYRRLYSNMDDVHQIITWTLSRQPMVGDALSFAPDFRLFTTTPIGKTPPFWVLYTFDAERVYLHSLQHVET
jgi:hypothetical protein